MERQNRVQSAGRFGTALDQALTGKGLEISEFSKMLDANYDHIRRIVKGAVYPSNRLLADMSKLLGLNHKKMEEFLTQDRLEKQFGSSNFQAALGRHRRAGEFDAILPHVTDDQVDIILTQMRSWARQNKRAAGTSAKGTA